MEKKLWDEVEMGELQNNLTSRPRPSHVNVCACSLEYTHCCCDVTLENAQHREPSRFSN